jgi:hypothetical protein
LSRWMATDTGQLDAENASPDERLHQRRVLAGARSATTTRVVRGTSEGAIRSAFIGHRPWRLPRQPQARADG